MNVRSTDVAKSPLDVLDALFHGLDDMRLSLPSTWKRRSIVTFTAPGAGARDAVPTFTVQREALGEWETLRNLVERQRRDFGGALVCGDPFLIDGYPALSTTSEWQGPDGAVYETTIFIETPAGGERFVTKVTATCSEWDVTEVHEVFARALESIHFDSATPASRHRRAGA